MSRHALAPWVLTLALAAVAWGALGPELQKALTDAKYVYIQSERRSGELSKPAEIWFFDEGGVVYVGTRPTSFRVQRIKAGHAKARIAVGTPGGPSFEATGKLVKDTALEGRLMAAFAKKYPDGWARYADGFRDGFKSGDRVVVAYTPR
ncbi:MAG TPA: hypothetical protein VGR62_11820 [Candidatus Binatia bacterium]|nr:hypothetical protein [Candidatus Binatia bacterium]